MEALLHFIIWHYAATAQKPVAKKDTRFSALEEKVPVVELFQSCLNVPGSAD